MRLFLGFLFGFIVWLIITMVISLIAPYLSALFVIGSAFLLVVVYSTDEKEEPDKEDK